MRVLRLCMYFLVATARVHNPGNKKVEANLEKPKIYEMCSRGGQGEEMQLNFHPETSVGDTPPPPGQKEYAEHLPAHCSTFKHSPSAKPSSGGIS